MNRLFDFVYRSLLFLSDLTGFSYQEINVIVYYIIAPLVFAFLLDKVFRFHYIKIGYTLIVLLTMIFVPDLHQFAYDLFVASQRFLQSFGWLGLDYIGASVVICVILPGLLLGYLFFLLYRKKRT